MLTLFLRVRAGVVGTGRPFGRGRGSADVGAGVGGPKCWEVARRVDFGVVGRAGIEEVDSVGIEGTAMPDFAGVVGVGRFPRLFLVLATGKAGRAMLGGPFEGLEGRGRAVAIVNILRWSVCGVLCLVAARGAGVVWDRGPPQKQRLFMREVSNALFHELCCCSRRNLDFRSRRTRAW